MSYFEQKVDPRSSQYGRFASDVLRTLKGAVRRRVRGGTKQKEIAGRLGWHPSQLSRVVNGKVENITIQTVSDILWACGYEPVPFSAEPVETIAPRAERLNLHSLHQDGSLILKGTDWLKTSGNASAAPAGGAGFRMLRS